MTRIEEALTEWFGSRCPDTYPGCVCCDAWAEYDALQDRVAELESCVAVMEATIKEAALSRLGYLGQVADVKARVAELENQKDSMIHTTETWEKRAKTLQARAEDAEAYAAELEAKLAKAVGGLKTMQQVPRSDASYGIMAVMISYTLAALEGRAGDD